MAGEPRRARGELAHRSRLRQRRRGNPDHHLVIPTELRDMETGAKVELPGAGLVSRATLEQLRHQQSIMRDHVREQLVNLRTAEALAEDRLADLSALLVPRRAWWSPPPELLPWLQEADRLVARITQLDLHIEAAVPRPAGTAGASLSRLIARVAGRDPVRERARAARRLRDILVRTGSWAVEQAPDVAGVPDTEGLLAQVHELRAWADQLRAAFSAASAQLATMDEEVRAREEAARVMGFDALHLGAHFRARGLPAVETPATLQRGEIAHLAVAATLARGAAGMRSPGRTPPAAQTGVRFWLGTFNSSSMPALTPINAGTLTVTNRFLHFTSPAQGVATPLANLVDLDVYTDGLAVVALGRETVDFYRVEGPREVAFFLNWALEAAS